jgi:DNA-binding response OmpR family regulator
MSETSHAFAGLLVDTERRRVTLAGPRGETPLLLRPKEYDLLRVLMRKPDVVLTRTIIVERVWGEDVYVSDNTLDRTVSDLRQRLVEARAETGADGPEIETIRGVGYRLASGV